MGIFVSRKGVVVVYSLLILAVSIMPLGSMRLSSSFAADKIVHSFLYGILAYVAVWGSKKPAVNYLFGFFYAFLWGAFIELIQYFLPYRSFEAADMLFNAFGAGTGIVFRLFTDSKH